MNVLHPCNPEACCMPGLHDAVAAELQALLPPGSLVLDIAAGRGAFTKRLVEMGYRVLANDINPAQWALTDIPLMNIDLNTDFSRCFNGLSIDAVVAIEIIEHLENPRAFFRECRRISPKQGLLIITSPNPTSLNSRLRFLVSGRVHHFSEESYNVDGHLTMLPWWMLHEHAKATGWQMERATFAGKYAPRAFWQLHKHLAVAAGRVVGNFFSPKERKWGCTIMILRAKENQ